MSDTRPDMFRRSSRPSSFAALVLSLPLSVACGGGKSGAASPAGNGIPSSTARGPAEDALATSAVSPTSSALTAPACPTAPPLAAEKRADGKQSEGQQYCSNQRGAVGNGYGYELWAAGHGTGCMTVLGNGATFKASWTNVEDFLARVGLDFDETKDHRQVGNIWAEFAETQTGSERGLTYVGIYGWTVNPLREFYIIEDWGTTKPSGLASDGTPREAVGTLHIDGETYDVWKKSRENKPSIKGTASFDQYFSIRRSARHCGRISVSEHLIGWEKHGLSLGNLYEVKLLVESQDNSGSVEFTTAKVAVD
jgi:endo-1,4-beta-xylanase